MKKVKLKTAGIFLATVCLSFQGHASDLDIYNQLNSVGGGSQNILFVMDASASVQRGYYENGIFSSDVNPLTNPSDSRASKLLGYQNFFASQLENTDIIPASATFHTATAGFGCSGDSSEGFGVGCSSILNIWKFPRIEIIRDVLRDTLPVLSDSQVGIMRTRINIDDFKYWSSHSYKQERSTKEKGEDDGAYVIQNFTHLNSTKKIQEVAQKLIGTYGYSDPNSKSPIAESLYEAYIYYTGQKSDWKKTSSDVVAKMDYSCFEGSNSHKKYISPLNTCSSNHIIVFTDGRPTWDWSANHAISKLTGTPLPTIPADPSSGPNEEDLTSQHTLIDEFVGYMANTDLDPSIDGKQTITTHFISTWPSGESAEMLDTAAASSGGFHISVSDISQLHSKLKELLSNIQSGAEPVIGYKVYKPSSLAFQGQEKKAFVAVWERKNGQWSGNLRKFEIGAKGILEDKKGNMAFAEGIMTEEAQDLWSTAAHGNTTQEGGAVGKLTMANNSRYTLVNPAKGRSIVATGNLISSNNSSIKSKVAALLGNSYSETLLDWAAGLDSFDLDGDLVLDEPRPSLGDSPHNAPAVLYADQGKGEALSVILPTNEGYIHAFDPDSGKMQWSFMPEEMLAKLPELSSTNPTKKMYGVDGTPFISYIEESDRTITPMLYISFGNGGQTLYAFDLSSATSPKFMWRITPNSSGFGRLGYIFEKPMIKNMSWNKETKVPVLILSGGYDPILATTPTATETLGNHLYLLNPLTGNIYASVGKAGSDANIPSLKSALIGKPFTLDLQASGRSDILYFNSVQGNIFRCNIKSLKEKDLTCNRIANVNHNSGLQFFGSMDVALTVENGTPSIAMSLVSGNLNDPLETTTTNRVVTIMDRNMLTPTSSSNNTQTLITESSLSNLTSNSTNKISKDGWYREFSDSGEKSFSQPFIFNHQVIISTFVPTTASVLATDPCSLQILGSAKIYGFDILTGKASKKSTIETTESMIQSTGVLWQTETATLPPPPNVIMEISGETVTSHLFLGEHEPGISSEFNPTTRTYWYEK